VLVIGGREIARPTRWLWARYGESLWPGEILLTIGSDGTRAGHDLDCCARCRTRSGPVIAFRRRRTRAHFAACVRRGASDAVLAASSFTMAYDTVDGIRLTSRFLREFGCAMTVPSIDNSSGGRRWTARRGSDLSCWTAAIPSQG